MFLLMPPIRKNLFAIYTKICYDCIRGIQQGVEILRNVIPRSDPADDTPDETSFRRRAANEVPPKWQRRRTVPVTTTDRRSTLFFRAAQSRILHIIIV